MNARILSFLATTGCVLATLALFNCGSPTGGNAPAALGKNPAALSFNRDIRPILSENCYTCHGPDHNARKADLRLDLREAALTNLKGHAAIVPGKSEESELIRRVSLAASEQRMPPASTGKTLTAEQIELLRRWIDEGATYEPHWSYIVPKRAEAPAVQNAAWVRNPIDRFILSRLEKEGLVPAPEADRRRLIRRLHADLAGIPPTAQQVEAFVADTRPDAYEQLVDSLLASPHYGERMALDWLDLVRYADSNGYHGDQPRQVWAYRDYVINAFNDNMPFDRFTIEQLAGDLVPNRTTQTLVATGYNRLNMVTAEGGAQDKEYLAKYAADRVRTTSSVWLGATMGCAECHDHKYDPYSAKDFYSFQAFFADFKETGLYYQIDENFHPYMRLPNAQQKAEQSRLEAEIAELRAKLTQQDEATTAVQQAWEAAMREKLAAGPGEWTVFKPEKCVSSNNAVLTTLADHSVLASGFEPSLSVYGVTGTTDMSNITAIRLEVMNDPSFSGLGRWSGNFAVTQFVTRLTTETATHGRLLKFAKAEADYEAPHLPVSAAISDTPTTVGWSVDGHVRNAQRQAMFVLKEPLAGGPGTTLKIDIQNQSTAFFRQNIGRFRLWLTNATSPTLENVVTLPEPIAAAILTEASQRTAEQSAALTAYYSNFAPRHDATFAAIKEKLAAKDKLESQMDLTLIVEKTEPRPIRVLTRGNWLDESGEIVEPQVPAFLAPALNAPGRRANRLDLAQWLVSKENPLTARVIVNRLWRTYYGIGLSRTLDDLGSQGEWPQHPELLDWLAVEFMESNWDVKHMVRLMVTSAAYRQSSDNNESLQELDPNNRLMARQSSYRIPAELLRDNALAISGLLVPTVGGKSVMPYQPAGYWDGLNFPQRQYVEDRGDNLYRRGIYTHWQRTFLNPELRAFDAPSREECTAERTISNTPLQALTLLNNPTYFEAARVFAALILREGGATTQDRIAWAYRSALSREPTAQESPVLAKLYDSHLTQYRADNDATSGTLHVGQAPIPEDLDHAELAAMTSVARTILNLHETIMRY